MLPISPKDLLFFITAAESLNPLSYSHLRHRNLFEVFSFLFSVVFVAMFVSSIFYLPFLINLDGNIASELGKFSELGLTYDASGSESSFSVYGVSAVSFRNSSQSALSIDESGISSRPLPCIAFAFSCGLFPPSSISNGELEDLSSSRDAVSAVMRNFILFLIPGIFISILVFYFVKFALIAAFAALFGLLMSKIFRLELNLYSSFSIGCYSCTVLAVPQIAAGSLGIDTLGLEWLAFFALFISAVLLSSKKIEGDKHGRGGSTENKQLGKGTA